MKLIQRKMKSYERLLQNSSEDFKEKNKRSHFALKRGTKRQNRVKKKDKSERGYQKRRGKARMHQKW